MWAQTFHLECWVAFLSFWSWKGKIDQISFLSRWFWHSLGSCPRFDGIVDLISENSSILREGCHNIHRPEKSSHKAEGWKMNEGSNEWNNNIICTWMASEKYFWQSLEITNHQFQLKWLIKFRKILLPKSAQSIWWKKNVGKLRFKPIFKMILRYK